MQLFSYALFNLDTITRRDCPRLIEVVVASGFALPECAVVIQRSLQQQPPAVQASGGPAALVTAAVVVAMTARTGRDVGTEAGHRRKVASSGRSR